MTWILLLEVLEGLVSITISLVALFLPGLTNTALIFLIAIWAILIGILKIIIALFWGQEMLNKWLTKINGIMAILLGLFLIICELSGADVLIMSLYIGAYTFIFGLLFFVFALNLRELQAASNSRPPPSPG
jgi:uncharacterized membrane protein HdeD (DUF308 family)